MSFVNFIFIVKNESFVEILERSENNLLLSAYERGYEWYDYEEKDANELLKTNFVLKLKIWHTNGNFIWSSEKTFMTLKTACCLLYLD